jgi:hypothetical protein
MKARIGNIVKVGNQNKKHSENAYYYSVILKDRGRVSSFIFTEAEIHSAFDRAIRNQEDCLERSFTSHILD